MKVYRALKDGNIIAARKAVSMIVGRDTEQLDEAGLQGRRWRLWLRALPTGL
jgi:cobalamin biosynthesis protein CobD/CbiB